MFFAHRIIEMSNCAPAAVRRGADRLGAKGVGGMRFTKTLRFRLIVVTVLCTAVVSLVGNLALFGYLNNILNQRADRIDEIYLSTLQNQLDEYLTDLSDLAILCSSDYTVSRALSPAATMKNAVDAQDRLNARLRRIAANDFSFVDEVPQELYACRIVKLTLQPLVENAIFHGIEPTGECGTITLTGRAEGDDLYLCVEDDGAGIEPERLATILTAESKRSGSSMNGIGIANVHKRLQLIYGRSQPGPRQGRARQPPPAGPRQRGGGLPGQQPPGPAGKRLPLGDPGAAGGVLRVGRADPGRERRAGQLRRGLSPPAL